MPYFSVKISLFTQKDLGFTPYDPSFYAMFLGPFFANKRVRVCFQMTSTYKLKVPQYNCKQRSIENRQLLHEVGADGVGVKFPIFAVNCSHLPLSCPLGEWEESKGTKKNEESKNNPPIPSTTTPLRAFQFKQEASSFNQTCFVRFPTAPQHEFAQNIFSIIKSCTACVPATWLNFRAAFQMTMTMSRGPCV